MDIAKIDANFGADSRVPADTVFHDVREAPFNGYGLYDFQNGPVFRRMPQKMAAEVSEGVDQLARHTAGGRVRFRTDSRYLVIRSLLTDCAWMGHMAFLGSCGYSIYITENGRTFHYKSVIPAAMCEEQKRNKLAGLVEFKDRGKRDITIYFPLYSGVEELWIGLEGEAVLEAGGTYRRSKPVLYYGSSITQGGCASRPGNSYEGFISRRLDCDYINLGFSGNGKGEAAMAEYLASLDTAVFVMDYDHNAPDVEYLRETHERLFRIYREKNPETPVIMVSKPDFRDEAESIRRRAVIRETYENALRHRDRNVYFIDGETLFQQDGLSDSDCTVDGVHPNDLGFYRMAEKIGDVILLAYPMLL